MKPEQNLELAVRSQLPAAHDYIHPVDSTHARQRIPGGRSNPFFIFSPHSDHLPATSTSLQAATLLFETTDLGCKSRLGPRSFGVIIGQLRANATIGLVDEQIVILQKRYRKCCGQPYFLAVAFPVQQADGWLLSEDFDWDFSGLQIADAPKERPLIVPAIARPNLYFGSTVVPSATTALRDEGFRPNVWRMVGAT